MPTIVFKKTFKIKANSFAAEKGLSFHGSSVTSNLIEHVNDALRTMPISGDSSLPQFKWNGEHGHYYASMNHTFQKRHEEDAVAEILDVMEAMGWSFQFQYDTSHSSERAFSASETSNELLLFNKEPEVFVIYKESLDTKAGIVFTVEERTGRIVVSKVTPGGVAEATGIQRGAVILSINGSPCKGKGVSEAVARITSTKGAVKLLTY